MQLKKVQSLSVCHNALIGGLKRPAIGWHMIKTLPHAILPLEIVRASFIGFPAHCIIPALLETVHGHHVRRACLRTALLPFCSIPEAKRRMNVDNVEFLARLLNVFSYSLRKLDRAKAIRPQLHR